MRLRLANKMERAVACLHFSVRLRVSFNGLSSKRRRAQKEPPPHVSMVASQLLELLKDNPNIPGINLRPIFTGEPRGWRGEEEQLTLADARRSVKGRGCR